jgi:hypothetical protein
VGRAIDGQTSGVSNAACRNGSDEEIPMKRALLISSAFMFTCVMVPFVTPVAAGNATLTSDPLTGLPLIPSTDSRLHLGNDPQRMHDTVICKSKAQIDFYSLNDGKVDATVAWYAGRLPGFRKTHAYGNQRSQDTFYKPDGTMIVSIVGSRGAEGENTDAYAVTYLLLQPGLSEKTIIGMNAQKIVCP